MISSAKLAQLIDHTNVHADATEEDIERLCKEAVKYNFFSVCVTPTNISLARKFLRGYDIGICSVVGFPLGTHTPQIKASEARESIQKGASEIDMVMNIGQLKSGRDELVREDIQGVVDAVDGKIVKVILETAFLVPEEKVKACLIAKNAGANFVKTSTGFGGLTGATVEDVRLLKDTVGSDMGVKAAGSIKDLETAMQMIDAGADRIGTSSGVQIMEESNKIN